MIKGCRKGCWVTLVVVGVIIVLLVLFVVGGILFIANPPEFYRKECPKYVDLYFTEGRNMELTELSQELLSVQDSSDVDGKVRRKLQDKHHLQTMNLNKGKGLVQLGYFRLRKWHMYFYRADENYLKNEKGYKNIRKLNENWHYVCW